MDVREMLNYYNAPDVKLDDIAVENLKQERAINSLKNIGINTTGELMNITNEELLARPTFGKSRLVKVCELITDWYERDFPLKNKLNVSKPESVMYSLLEVVFYRYKNLQTMAMRANYQTYESIAAQFGHSRQSVKDRENFVVGKFIQWYEENGLKEKIGDYDDFLLYCTKNFPEDQREVKAAVRKLVSIVKRK